MTFRRRGYRPWVTWAVAAPFIFGAVLLLGVIIGLLSVTLAGRVAVYFIIASPIWGLAYLLLFFYLLGAGEDRSEQ
ncbi:MAG: hypothetical protein WCK97_03625 [Actinomycetes bacterium]